MKTQLSVPQILLILAGLLAPIFGGYVASDGTAVGPDGLLAAMGAGQAPVLQHALIALPVFAALAFLLVQRRVQQIPYPYVAAALVLLVGSLAPAVAFSNYRAVGLGVWIEWAAYAVAYLAAVAGLGRRVGPVALLGAVALGVVWIARVGVLEYLTMRRIDPTWRVFCGWNNPNAAAAMLVLGFLGMMGLPVVKERSASLLLNLGVVVGGGLTLCALLLTGSKGGTLLALPTGLVVLGLVAGRRNAALYVVGVLVLGLSAYGFLKSQPYLGVGAALLFAAGTLLTHRVQVGRLIGAFAFGGLMLAFFASTTPGAQGGKGIGGTTGATRIAAAASTQDQSATFRLNLWKSAAALAKERPVTGWGPGSYRSESSRPGLVTETVFAHNTYLQLAAEAGVVPLVLLASFFVTLSIRAFRGVPHLTESGRLAFGAAAGGVASVLAHCLVDSDLSYFGLGLAFFLVLGAATLLATDAVAPEFVPRSSRSLAALGVATLWAFFAYLGWADLAKGEVRYAQGTGSPGDVDSIAGLAGWDGDAAYLWGRAQPDPEPALKRAFDLQPTPKIARYLASLQAQKGELAAAESTLYRVLPADPNNLKVLYLLAQMHERLGDEPGAVEVARRLVAVERSPYFTIRSLDQLVATETYLARITILAPAETDAMRRANLLAEGVRGLRRYADVTVPAVLNAVKTDPKADYAGEHLADAKAKLTVGAEAARTAAGLFRARVDRGSAEEMDEDAAAFAKAIPE